MNRKQWPVVRLGTIAEFRNGLNYNKGNFGKGLKVVNVKDFQDRLFADFNALDEINPNGVLRDECLLKDGDILFVRSNGNRELIGRSMLVKGVTEAISHSAFSIKARLHGDDVLPLFYAYVFRSALIRTELSNRGGGTNISNLNQDILNSLEVPKPSTATQHKIASILSAYDDLIENNIRRVATLEAMAQAIYREWFVEFRFPGHEKAKLLDSQLGKIPEGWKVKPLAEIAAITMGTSPNGDTYNEEGDGTPLVNGPVEFGERFTKQVKWTTAPSKFCKEGDLVVCVRGSTTGKYVKSNGVYCLGRGVCGLSSKYQCFVNLLFENERPALLTQAGGSTFPSWTGPQLKLHPVVSPPAELLERFEEMVKPMAVAVLVYSRQMENFRKTRDLLLPKLISGQLDLEDFEIETEGPLVEAGA